MWQAIATGPGSSSWFVPPQFDKSEADRSVRELVRSYIPTARVVDVRFGDNFRTKARALDHPEDEPLVHTHKPKPAPVLPKAQDLK